MENKKKVKAPKWLVEGLEQIEKEKKSLYLFLGMDEKDINRYAVAETEEERGRVRDMLNQGLKKLTKEAQGAASFRMNYYSTWGEYLWCRYRYEVIGGDYGNDFSLRYYPEDKTIAYE